MSNLKRRIRVNKDVEEFFPNKEFINIDRIEISNQELQYIRELDNKNLEKISFIMLVYAKITNKVLKEELNWVGSKYI